MAMTPEAKVKKQVTRQLDAMGAYYFYPVTGGYGKSGVPDIVGCYRALSVKRVRIDPRLCKLKT